VLNKGLIKIRLFIKKRIYQNQYIRVAIIRKMYKSFFYVKFKLLVVFPFRHLKRNDVLFLRT